MLNSDNDLALATGDEISVAIVRRLDLKFDGMTVPVGKEMNLLEGRVSSLTDTELTVAPLADAEVIQLRFDGAEEDGRVFYKALRNAQEEYDATRG